MAENGGTRSVPGEGMAAKPPTASAVTLSPAPPPSRGRGFKKHAVEPRRCGAASAQSEVIGLNPPMNMRMPSNGIAFGFMIAARRGSFIALALMRSRCARDL